MPPPRGYVRNAAIGGTAARYRRRQRPPVLAPGVKIKVAILLPLSGRNAPLGQAMLNAAQLAVFDVADQHFELMPRDTASSEAGSGNAARDAAASGAQLFIGPVFANDVEQRQTDRRQCRALICWRSRPIRDWPTIMCS